MIRRVKNILAFLAVIGLVACADADTDSGISPSLSGSTTADSGSEGGKQPTILPGPDHQEGIPTDEGQEDGVPGGTDVAPPVTPDALSLAPNVKFPQ